jgi:hypothetical protein
MVSARASASTCEARARDFSPNRSESALSVPIRATTKTLLKRGRGAPRLCLVSSVSRRLRANYGRTSVSARRKVCDCLQLMAADAAFGCDGFLSGHVWRLTLSRHSVSRLVPNRALIDAGGTAYICVALSRPVASHRVLGGWVLALQKDTYALKLRHRDCCHLTRVSDSSCNALPLTLGDVHADMALMFVPLLVRRSLRQR